MKTILKIIGIVLAVICSICLLVSLLVTHSIFAASDILSDNRTDKILKSLDMNYILKDEDDNKTTIYRKIDKIAGDLELTEEDKVKIVNSNGFKTIFAAFIDGAKSSYIYGETEYVLSEIDIVNLVNINLDDMLKDVSVEIPLETREKLREKTIGELSKIASDLPSSISLYRNYSYLKYVRDIFDIKLKLEAIGVIAGLILLTILFTWGIGRGLKYSGITIMISSLLVILFGGFIILVFSYVLKNISLFANYVSLLKPTLKEIGLVFVSNGIIGLGISIIMLVVASIISQRKEKRLEQGTILAN